VDEAATRLLLTAYPQMPCGAKLVLSEQLRDLRPEPQRGSCVVSALSGHLRRHSGSLHSAWESFSLFYLASRRASVLRIGCILENLPVAKSFFLRFSFSDVPYISRGPWPKLRPLGLGRAKKVHFSFLLFPDWMFLK